jgi:hypothetical protein
MNKIVNSPTIKEDLELLRRDTRILSKLMICDVSTRWNSTAKLVQCTLELKNALRILVVKADHNKPQGVRLARFTLSEEEWVLLKQLSPLLEVRGLLIFGIHYLYFPLAFPLCHKTNLLEHDSAYPPSYPHH